MFERFIQGFRKEKTTLEEEVVYFDSQIDHAPDRNFDIEMEEKEDGEITLKLRRNDGDVYDLDDVLPEKKYTFQEDDEEEGGFSHSWEEGVDEVIVHVPTQQINRRDFLLNTFHELGHANQHQQKEGLGKILREIPKLEQVLEDLVSEETMSEEEQEIFQSLSKTLSEKELSLERNAWAWALTELRYLEEQGYDVFSGFGKSKLQEDGTYRREKPRKEIMEYIYDCLSTYEEEVEE